MPLACSLTGRAMRYAPASRAQVNSCASTTSQLRGNGSCTLCRPDAPGRQRAGHLKGAGARTRATAEGGARRQRKTPSRPWERQRLALTTPDDSCTMEHPHEATTTPSLASRRCRRKSHPRAPGAGWALCWFGWL